MFLQIILVFLRKGQADRLAPVLLGPALLP